MNQADLRRMAEERIKDAKALIRGKRWEFAYYTAGYSIECALKSCVLARMIHTAWVFEEKWNARDCLTHDLKELIRLAGLNNELLARQATSRASGDAVRLELDYGCRVDRHEPILTPDRGRRQGPLRRDHSQSGRGIAMDQKMLVDDQIDDGQRIIDQFLADGLDVSVAFWVKPDERSWTLYIASPGFRDRERVEASRTVYDSASKVPDLTIQPGLDIRVIDARDAIARDAVRLAGRKGKKGPIRYRGTRLGDFPIVRAYIYPRPAVPLRQSFTISYERQGESDEWAATTEKGPLHRWLRPKGVVSYATHGPGDDPDDEQLATILVLVEVEPRLDERTIAINPALATMLADQARSLADGIFKKKHPEAAIHHHDMALAPV